MGLLLYDFPEFIHPLTSYLASSLQAICQVKVVIVSLQQNSILSKIKAAKYWF